MIRIKEVANVTGLPSLRFIIAHGDPDSAAALALCLTLRDHEVKVCHDSASLSSIVDSFAPDGYVIDVTSARFDGYRMAEMIRARPAGRPPFLLALIDWASGSDLGASWRAGFDKRLFKQMDPFLVATVVEAAVAERVSVR